MFRTKISLLIAHLLSFDTIFLKKKHIRNVSVKKSINTV